MEKIPCITHTCEYDAVLWGIPPSLHEVHSVPTPQRGVAGEHHTGGLIHRAEATVDVGEVLQSTTADELHVGERLSTQVRLASGYRHSCSLLNEGRDVLVETP